VVEQGSFLAAADTLAVSRTTLRRRVGALEARVGVQLLKSTQAGVVLTEAGRVLARRGRTLAEETSALLASVREVGQEPAGVMKLSMPVGLPPHLLTPLFAALRATYPRLCIENRCSNDPLAESLVDVDIAVHFTAPPSDGKWLSYEIMQIHERLVASPEYLGRKGTPGSLDELAQHELLAWQAPDTDPRAWPLRKGGTFPVEPTLVSPDIHFVRHCCIAGLGIGFVLDAMLPDPGLPEDALVPVLPELIGRERAVRVTVPEALADTPKLKRVLDRIREFLGET